MLKKRLKKLFGILSQKKECDFNELKEIIDSLPEPKNDYERIYYNHLVNNHPRYAISDFVLNLLGLIGEIVVLPVYLVNRIFIEKNDQMKDCIVINATNRFGTVYSIEDRLPYSLEEKYGSMQEIRLQAFPGFFEGVMSKAVLSLWIGFRLHYPAHTYLSFRCLLNLAGYQKLLYQYHPKAIANSRVEVNNMSSIVTSLCEISGCEYLCFMHGTMVYEPMRAFVRFSAYYLWDMYYADIMRWSRCSVGEYRLYTPRFISYRLHHPEANTENVITYYLSGSTLTCRDKNSKEVVEILERLTLSGYKCYIRPHPRWSNSQEIEALCTGKHVIYEDPLLVNIEESLHRTKYCLGLFSTVLLEAHYTDNICVLDNVTNQEAYQLMRSKGLILFAIEHIELSTLLNLAAL